MNTESLKRQFAQMDAVLEVEFMPELRRSRWSGRQVNPPKTNFWLDVREARQDESFVLTVREDARDQLDFLAVDVQPRQRHLLLLTKRLVVGQVQKEKFLCGHDERHWFVAGVPAVGVPLWSSGIRTYLDNPCPTASGYVDDYGGVIRNNFVVANSSSLFASGYGFDCGICLWNACNARALHNTVYTTDPVHTFSALEWRFANTRAEVRALVQLNGMIFS